MTVPPINARYLARAAETQRRLIANLRKDGSARAGALAAILECCTADNPYRSGACQLCGSDFQLMAANLVAMTIGKEARDHFRSRMQLETIIPGDGSVVPELLTVDLVRRIKADIMAGLIECGVPPSVLAIDISFNEDALGEIPPHPCVHAHGAGLGWPTKRQVAALKERFPRTELVGRPIKCERLDHKVEGRLYAFKPTRIRRVSDIVAATDQRAAHRDTHRRSLRPWQAVKFALIEHAFGYRGRLITHEIDESAVGAAFDAFEWARDGPE